MNEELLTYRNAIAGRMMSCEVLLYLFSLHTIYNVWSSAGQKLLLARFLPVRQP